MRTPLLIMIDDQWKIGVMITPSYFHGSREMAHQSCCHRFPAEQLIVSSFPRKRRPTQRQIPASDRPRHRFPEGDGQRSGKSPPATGRVIVSPKEAGNAAANPRPATGRIIVFSKEEVAAQRQNPGQ
jgi:hypothetical protein